MKVTFPKLQQCMKLSIYIFILNTILIMQNRAHAQISGLNSGGSSGGGSLLGGTSMSGGGSAFGGSSGGRGIAGSGGTFSGSSGGGGFSGTGNFSGLSSSGLGGNSSTGLSQTNFLSSSFDNPIYQGRAGATIGTTPYTPGGFNQPSLGTVTTGGAGVTGGVGGIGGIGGIGGRGGAGMAGGVAGIGGTSGNASRYAGPSNPFRANRLFFSANLQFSTNRPFGSAMEVKLRDIVNRSTKVKNPGNLQILVDNNNVVLLRGTVISEKEKTLVEGLIRLTPGVRYVQNELQINNPSVVSENLGNSFASNQNPKSFDFQGYNASHQLPQPVQSQQPIAMVNNSLPINQTGKNTNSFGSTPSNNQAFNASTNSPSYPIPVVPTIPSLIQSPIAANTTSNQNLSSINNQGNLPISNSQQTIVSKNSTPSTTAPPYPNLLSLKETNPEKNLNSIKEKLNQNTIPKVSSSTADGNLNSQYTLSKVPAIPSLIQNNNSGNSSSNSPGN